MYISGALNTFENRLHQLPINTGDLFYFRAEDNSYFFNTGQEQHINREYQRKYFSITRDASYLTGWYMAASSFPADLIWKLDFGPSAAYNATVGPNIPFSRSTVGTRVNSLGLIETMSIDAPRIDYDPTTLACKGLLIEESRINYALYSEDLTDAVWVKNNVTVSSNQSIAPDGLTTADLVSDSIANSTHSIYNNSSSLSVTVAANYSFSFFIKKGTGATAPSWFLITFDSSKFGTKYLSFNIDTGSFDLTSGLADYTMTQYINGWWRISVSASATVAGVAVIPSINFTNNTNTSSAPTYVGLTTSDVFIWGAQWEQASTAGFESAYIKTNNSTQVRAIDNPILTAGADFNSIWSGGSRTLLVKYFRKNDGAKTILHIGNAVLERFTINWNGSRDTLTIVSAGSTNINTSVASQINTLNRIAVRFQNLNSAISLNGGAPTVNSTKNIFASADTISLGNRLNSVYLNGHIYSIEMYNTAKTNAELQTLSA